MLLEVNRLKYLIVDRPDRADLDLWSGVCAHLTIAVVVADDEEAVWWSANLPIESHVLVWSAQFVNEVAANISLALDELDAQPYESAFVTANSTSIAEAMGTRVGTMLRSSGVGETIPDIILFGEDDIGGILQRLSQGVHYGFLSELFATRYGEQKRAAGTGFYYTQKFLQNRIELDAQLRADLDVVVAGRYFPTKDARHSKHQLSMRLLFFKNGDARGNPIIEALSRMIKHAVEGEDLRLITRVPPKPSKPHDYLGDALKQIGRTDKNIAERTDLGAITCVREYLQQKSAGGFDARVENVRGAFTASPNVAGKSVLLVDDILTSGATVMEIASVLYAAGATDVTVCPVGIDQSSITYSAREEIPCPLDGCGGIIQIRYPFNSNKAFWGCSNWTFNGGCPISIPDFVRGLHTRNELNSRDAIVLYDNDPF